MHPIFKAHVCLDSTLLTWIKQFKLLKVSKAFLRFCTYTTSKVQSFQNALIFLIHKGSSITRWIRKGESILQHNPYLLSKMVHVGGGPEGGQKIAIVEHFI